jgi:hypothetical protein
MAWTEGIPGLNLRASLDSTPDRARDRSIPHDPDWWLGNRNQRSKTSDREHCELALASRPEQ